MSFSQEVLAPAKDIIVEFNAHVPSEHQCPIDDLETRLWGIGSATEEDLKNMTWEDWEDIGFPKRIARKVAAVYRGTTEEQSPSSQQTMTIRTQGDVLSELSNEELLIRFKENPNMVHGPLADQLRARSRNRRFLAYHPDGTIDVATTVMVLNGIAEGDRFNGIAINSNNRRVQLFKVGQSQGDVRAEHPLYPGNALRKDGMDKHNINWKSVPIDCQQLIRIAVETGEISPEHMSREEMIHLRSLSLQENGFESLQEYYPDAGQLFEERSRLDNLPALKVFAGTGRKTKERAPTA